MNNLDVSAFIAVADYGSIKAAAENLFASESTVSRRIRSLEQDLGIDLLVRSRKGTELTAAGRQLIDDARRIVDAVGDLSAKAHTLAIQAHPVLRIGYIGFSYEEIALVFAAKATAQRFPGFEANFIMDQTPDIIEKLEKGEIDAGLLFNGSLPEHHSYRVRQIGVSDPIAIVPKSHPLANRTTTTMADFVDATFLSEGPRPGALYLDRFKTQLRNLGASRCEVRAVGSYKSIPALVAAGQGVGIANKWMANPFSKYVSFVPINEDRFDIHVDFVWRPDVDIALAVVFAKELEAALTSLCA